MAKKKKQFDESPWLPEPEGQLSVDVIEGQKMLWVRSAIAGIKAEDLDIHVTTDTITIRGKRHHNHKESEKGMVHVQECHWGEFSRSVVLPCQIHPEKADAVLRRGILTIALPKAEIDSKLSVLELE